MGEKSALNHTVETSGQPGLEQVENVPALSLITSLRLPFGFSTTAGTVTKEVFAMNKKAKKAPEMLKLLLDLDLGGSEVCWGRSRSKANKRSRISSYRISYAGLPRLKVKVVGGHAKSIPTKPGAAMALLWLPEKQCKQLVTSEHRDNCISMLPSLASPLTLGSCRGRS